MAPMDTWQSAAEPGGFTGANYDYGGAGDYGGDINPQGAGSDPFAYTQGSLLTPWTGRFSSAGYGGGYSAPAYTKFNYQDFGYNAPSPGRFTENYADPAAFRFADFAGPSQFKAPTEEDMKADPGYQARMNAGLNAGKAAAAHSGAMRTGGFAKGMQDYAQNAASQEYGNVYGRKSNEWDREFGRAKDTYGINQGNTKTAFDTNTANKLAAYNTRQNAWKGNADVALQEGTLGYNIAQGTWDRNYQKARQGYEDDAAHAQAVASAGAANAGASYERDLADYNRARDEFWTNQDRQSALINNQQQMGLSVADRMAGVISGGYGNMADYGVGGADARAAGMQASGNAWGDFGQGIGNTIGGLALYQGQQPRAGAPTVPRMPTPTYGLSGQLPGQSMGMPSVPSYSPSGLQANQSRIGGMTSFGTGGIGASYAMPNYGVR